MEESKRGNRVGAAWKGTSQYGKEYWSIQIEVDGKRWRFYMLPVPPKTSKHPTHVIYMNPADNQYD